MTLLCTGRRISIAAALLATSFSPSAGAQSLAPQPAFSVNVGAFQYDLSGTGTSPMIAVRGDFPLSRVVLVEGSIALARPDQQFGERTTIVIPEAQFQLQMPLGPVMPYVGAGGGAAMDFRSARAGGTISRVTVSAAGGIRTWITPRVGIRAELRLRGIGTSFGGSAAEWTGGLSWRL